MNSTFKITLTTPSKESFKIPILLADCLNSDHGSYYYLLVRFPVEYEGKTYILYGIISTNRNTLESQRGNDRFTGTIHCYVISLNIVDFLLKELKDNLSEPTEDLFMRAESKGDVLVTLGNFLTSSPSDSSFNIILKKFIEKDKELLPELLMQFFSSKIIEELNSEKCGKLKAALLSFDEIDE